MRNVELRTGVCRGYAVVVLCGQLDTRDAGETAAAVAALAAGGQQLIIDLETLDFIDCHAVGALLGVRATARQAGGDVLLAARAGAAAADRAGRTRCPCQCGRCRGQRRQARCPAACGQHRTTREGGAFRRPVLDDGMAGVHRPGHDSRDVTRRRCAIFGAGRVRCVAACGVPARSGLPRHRLPAGRLPRVPSRPRRARANGRAREQRRGCAGGRVSGMGADPASLARRWSRGVRAQPAARGGVPAFRAESATGRWRQRAVSSWGCLLYSAFCLSTARLLLQTPPRQTAQSEQRQDIDVTATVLRTGWGQLPPRPSLRPTVPA